MRHKARKAMKILAFISLAALLALAVISTPKQAEPRIAAVGWAPTNGVGMGDSRMLRFTVENPTEHAANVWVVAEGEVWPVRKSAPLTAEAQVVCVQTQDALNATRAFFTKQPPTFEGE